MEKLKKATAWLDMKMEKFVSRKLLVFVCASGYLCMERLGENNWTYIAMTYIGSQALIDGFVKWKSGK